jgi:flagellar motor switch protein FliM
VKPERAFVADRTLASHSADLLRAGPPPVDLVPAFSQLAERMARILSRALAPLLAGEAPVVRANAVRECEAGELGVTIAPLAANCLLAMGEGPGRLLASIEAEPVLRMVDRAFGGRGAVPNPLPDRFPLSAELMIARLEGVVCDSLAQAIGGTAAPRAVERSGSLAEIAPFGQDTMLALLSLDVEETGGEGWSITLAAPLAVLEALFGKPAPAAGKAAAKPAPRQPGVAPFADLPLTVSAVVVDMAMPVSALSGLKAGDIIPVAVARSVPLMVGETCIARGTIGACDDRVAVQVTQAFEN